MSLVTKFFKKPLSEKGLYLETTFWLGISRLEILILPFRWIAPFLGQHMASSDGNNENRDRQTVISVSRAILTMSRHLPWESKCLVQAISGKMMLSRRKIPSTLYLGVAKKEDGDLNAHAWLRVGGIVALGGGWSSLPWCRHLPETRHFIERVASDEILDIAFDWVCKRRIHYSHNSDIWDLRLNWQEIKPKIQQALVSGDYTFSALKEIRTDSDIIELWCATDALVLKALAIVLGEHLNDTISEQCHHVQGRGGTKQAIRNTMNVLAPGSYVMKSDVKGYYASMDHEVLFGLAEQHIPDRFVLLLIRQYLNRTVCFGENYKEITRGISLGCPLSPLMGALYLKPLDDALEKSGLFYARFMDDWVIIAPNRWKLRKAVYRVNQVLNALKVEKHPDKTFIGRADKGFDFLGYHFEPGSLTPSNHTVKKHVERISRLYEQGAEKNRIRQYVRRWVIWLQAGVVSLTPPCPSWSCDGMVWTSCELTHELYVSPR